MTDKCIICNGKYSVYAVALTCTSEPVCKKHIEEIIEILRKKQKNKKEFNLSEKIQEMKMSGLVYLEKDDIKEFIKRLKEDSTKLNQQTSEDIVLEFLMLIDKLGGEELSK